MAVKHDRGTQRDDTAAVNTRTQKAAVPVIGGLPAAGKITFARELASAAQAALVDRDTLMGSRVRGGLLAGENPNDYTSPAFLTSLNPAGYKAAERTAVEIATCGCTSILLGPYTRQAREGRDWWDKLVGEYPEVDFRLLWMVASREVIEERMRDRAWENDASKLADFDRWWDQQYTAVPCSEPVDATLPPSDNVAEVLAGQRLVR